MQRSSLDHNTLRSMRMIRVCKRSICKNPQSERLGVLGEQGCGVLGLGFDDLLAPFNTTVRRECVERVGPSLAEMLDLERIQDLVVLRVKGHPSAITRGATRVGKRAYGPLGGGDGCNASDG